MNSPLPGSDPPGPRGEVRARRFLTGERHGASREARACADPAGSPSRRRRAPAPSRSPFPGKSRTSSGRAERRDADAHGRRPSLGRGGGGPAPAPRLPGTVDSPHPSQTLGPHVLPNTRSRERKDGPAGSLPLPGLSVCLSARAHMFSAGSRAVARTAAGGPAQRAAPSAQAWRAGGRTRPRGPLPGSWRGASCFAGSRARPA